MRAERFTGLALVALAFAQTGCPPTKSDYPTQPSEMAKLCDAIGETPKISVTPKDRVWFQDHCECKPTITERQAKMPDGTPYTTREVGPVVCSARGTP
jgi:hypothetical protein